MWHDLWGAEKAWKQFFPSVATQPEIHNKDIYFCGAPQGVPLVSFSLSTLCLLVISIILKPLNAIIMLTIKTKMYFGYFLFFFFLILRCGDVNRSGAIALKDSLLLIVPKRKDTTLTRQYRATWGSTRPGSVSRQKEQGESTGWSLYCGFHRNEWFGKISQLSRFRIR